MSNIVIETTNLTKSFGLKEALSDFTLQVESGGVHALIGSNGAGKSTLFRILLGFLVPDSGESVIFGEDSRELRPETRGRVGYVNEEHTLPGWLTVKALEKMQRSYYSNWQQDIYQEVIRNFDVDPGQKVSTLSRGERAGFNLAMALAQNPQLLILDEPTLGLDVVAKQEFLDSILFCSETDTTVIYCSHQMEEVERLADELIIMENGRMRSKSTLEEFSQRISCWIVDAEYGRLVQETDLGLLSGRVIEDKYQFYVLDEPKCFASKLGVLGIKDGVKSDIGLPNAVRAYLSKNHQGREE